MKSWVRAGMYELVMFDGCAGELLERGTSALLGIFLSYYQWPLVRTNRCSDSAKNTSNSLSFLPVQVLINHDKSPLDHM